MTAIELSTGLAFLLLTGLPSPLRYSPPLINGGSDVLACVAQNVGDHAVMVAAELRAPNGTVSASGSAEVEPGGAVELVQSAAGASGYCVFTVDADPANVRGYIRRRSADGATAAQFPVFTVRGNRSGLTVTTTPPLRSISSALLGCLVQNLSAASVEVETELVNADGTVDGATTDAIPAGHFGAVRVSAANHLGAYCRFSVETHTDELRGYALLFGGGEDNAHLVLPATSASPVGSLVGLSPPVSSVEGDATICGAQSLAAGAVQVDAEVVDSAGVVLDTGSAMLAPGEVKTVAGHTEAGADMVCRFSFSDTADQVRAYVTRFPAGLGRSTDLLELASTPGGSPPTDRPSVSPPLGTGGDRLLHCAAVNLTPGNLDIDVAIEAAGAVVDAIDGITVPASRAQGALSEADLADAVCRFGFDAGPDNLRGYAALTSAGGLRTTRVFAAAPAGPTSTATPTATRTRQSTVTATPTPTVTDTPTLSATKTDTPTLTPTPTATPISTATATVTPIATATPSATISATPTSSATPSKTISATPASSATPSASATAIASPSPSAAICVGDCDGDGDVVVAELVTLVNIALGAPLDPCPAGDRDHDGAVGIDELVVAVGHALLGCPA
ncbi:MAG: hypothetical protein SF182_29585 [Deltaproteobacteria bacterium]|nr:hypothetical protein [Deltaproteobacteria bacterium]